MVHPEYNLPANEMFFSEASVGPHMSGQNNKENI